MNAFKLLIFAVTFCAAAACAQAQIRVDLAIKRKNHLLYEPIVATVGITNLSGRDVFLADTDEGGQWFSFQITDSEGRVIPPRDLNYQLQPLNLPAGQTVKRSVNLFELYSISNYGSYKVRSSVYFPGVGKYFGSRFEQVDITEGRTIWKETVGAPNDESGKDGVRTFTLLTLGQDEGKMLYVRVMGEDDDVVYGTYNLGRMVSGTPFDAKFDNGNNLCVLHLINPKTYYLSRIGINGQFYGQSTYVTPKKQPFLRKQPDGTLQIVGAIRQERKDPATEEEVPKLSDRPAGLSKR